MSDAMGALLTSKELDGMFIAAGISLPAAAELIGSIPNIDPLLLHNVRYGTSLNLGLRPLNILSHGGRQFLDHAELAVIFPWSCINSQKRLTMIVTFLHPFSLGCRGMTRLTSATISRLPPATRCAEL